MFQINNNDFKILNVMKSFITKVDDCLENIPRRDIYYKDYLRKIMYKLLETILIINYMEDTNGIVLEKNKLKSYIALIDFLLERLYNKRYINEKTLYKLGRDLTEINKMSTSWVNKKSGN